MRIRSIEIAGVKGIRQAITLSLEGKSFVVHGENGTGKSSMVNALSWVLRDESPPIPDDPYSTEASFRTHVLERRDAPFVKVTLSDGGTIEGDSRGIRTTGTGETYRAAALGANPILTRSKLLAVVSDKPADRFRYLESFLDLDQADEIRDAIGTKAGELSSRGRQLADKVRQMLLPATNAIAAEPVSGTEALTAALGQAAARLGLAQPLPSWEQIVEAGRRARALSPPDEHEEKRGRLNGALSVVQNVESQAPAGTPDLDVLNQRRTALLSEVTDAGLADLLALAQKHLAHARVDRCPLCEQPVDHESLRKSVEQRLGKLDELRQVVEGIRTAGRSWQRWWVAFTEALSSTVLPILNAKKVSELEGMPEAFAGARILGEKKDASADEFVQALLASGYRVSNEWVSSALTVLKRVICAELAKLPTAATTAQFRAFADAVERLSTVRAQVLQLEHDAAVAERHATSLQRLGDAVRLARQDVAQRLLNTISSTVADYYSRIHPRDEEAEVTDAPVIEIQRHRDGTAFVRGQFNGKRIPDPRWAYSDGHQDTIGLCIFLALRKYRAQGRDACRLMVLDDVVLSIDLPHTTRVARLIKEEFSDHQLLFLTHNKLVADLWKEPVPSSQRIDISRWSLEEGPSLGDYISAREALAAALEDGSATDIGQRILGLMEEWVCQARFEYQLAVPARRGERYTLGDVWPKFVSTMRETEKRLKSPIGRLAELLNELKELPMLRNSLWGHFNESAQQFPLSAVRQLGRWTIELVDVLYCSSCESFAVPYPDPNKPVVVACRCGRLKYGPPGSANVNAQAAEVFES